MLFFVYTFRTFYQSTKNKGIENYFYLYITNQMLIGQNHILFLPL